MATTITSAIASTTSHAVSRSTPRRLSSVFAIPFSNESAIRFSGADTHPGTRLVVEAAAVIAALEIRGARAGEERGDAGVHIDVRLSVGGDLDVDDAVARRLAAGGEEEERDREEADHRYSGRCGIDARACSQVAGTSTTGFARSAWNWIA